MEEKSAEHQILEYIKTRGVNHGIGKFWEDFDMDVNACKHFLQFVVDFLHRDYILNENEIKNIDERLICKIFNSKITNILPTDVSCKQIVMLFLENAFEFDLYQPVVESCQILLTSFLKNEAIPDDDTILGRCLLMLSHFLDPLAYYQLRVLDDPLDPDYSAALIDLGEYIPKILGLVLDLVLDGAVFKEHCNEISTELIKVVEREPEFFINKMGVLSKYIKLLEIDNNFSLTNIIRSLIRLCGNATIKFTMINFFYHGKYQIDDDDGEKVTISIRDLLLQLAVEKNNAHLSAEMIQLFNVIAELNRNKKFLSENQRKIVYKQKIVINHEGNMMNLLKMMTLYEGDVFVPLVNALNEAKATGQCVGNVIMHCTNLRGLSLMAIAKVITSHIRQPLLCIRACQVFYYVHQHIYVSDEFYLLQRIHDVLEKCWEDEISFGTFIDFILSAPRGLFITALVRLEKMRKDLIELLFSSLESFSHPKVIQKILEVIKVIRAHDPNLVRHQIKLVMGKLYEEFIEIDASQIAGLNCTKNFENSLVKMTMMYEMNVISFTDYFEYDAILIINRKMIEDTKGHHFLHFARFHTTLLKFSFIFLLKKKQNNLGAYFPVTLEQIVEYACALRNKLMEYAMKTERLENNYDAYLLLTSIFELHYGFMARPTLIENSTQILYITQPKMETASFRKLINLLENNIASNEDDTGSVPNELFKYNGSHFGIQLIESFTNFLKNYQLATNVTQTFKIIYHYSEDDFHDAIHTLLKYIQFKPEFPQIIGFSIMNFCITNMPENDVNFAIFVSYLNQFLEVEKKLNIKVDVVKFVLNNLPQFSKKISSYKNRVAVLKFLNIFMKKYNPQVAAELVELAKKVTSELTLKPREKATVEKFIKEIHNREE